MKVTVKSYLNVRVGNPSISAPCYQYLAPGSELEVDGKLYTGDYYEDTNKWLKDDANNYYWAGGTNFQRGVPDGLTRINPEAYNYWHLSGFGIKEIHDKGYRGQDINICVIDSGIAKEHPAFNYIKISGKCFTGQKITDDFTDDHGHGTKCAGIIAANGEKIIGVACELVLSAYKAYSYTIEKEVDIIFAIENIPDNIHVVSISYVLMDISLLPRLAKAVNRLLQKNVIVVAAHGNNDFTPNLLSSFDGVISVGAVDKNGAYKEHTCSVGEISILGPGVDIYTTLLQGKYAEDTGTSFATPFVASVCAIIKQLNINIDSFAAKQIIMDTGHITTDGHNKIISPLEIVNQLLLPV